MNGVRANASVAPPRTSRIWGTQFVNGVTLTSTHIDL
jgi:hypothetical protein